MKKVKNVLYALVKIFPFSLFCIFQLKYKVFNVALDTEII
jgi:hypothetical protein